MKDIEFINSRLDYYLKNEEYKKYYYLIEETMKDNVSVKAKYNLYLLLMNLGTEKIITTNLTKRLREMYSDYIDIDLYINNCIHYNPMFNMIEITALHRRDMIDDGNHGIRIQIPINYHHHNGVHSDYVDNCIINIKEVLKMILMEARSVPLGE